MVLLVKAAPGGEIVALVETLADVAKLGGEELYADGRLVLFRRHDGTESINRGLEGRLWLGPAEAGDPNASPTGQQSQLA